MKRERMDQKAILENKIDEGEAIGIEKEKIQTAKRLLQTGCEMDLIVQATNLSREQIENLKNKELFVA